jgi:signal transduction histidine kinase
LGQRFPYDPNAPTGLPKVIRTGQPDFYPVITDEMLVAAAPDEEILELLRDIGYSSSMLVPMKIRNEVIGALQFVATQTSRHYTEQDLELAQELAGRAAMAVDNARLYAEAQQAIAIRENFLSMAAHELKTPVTSLRGFAQLLVRRLDLQKELEPARLRQALETINQQSERLLRLIIRLLDLSKLEAGRLELEPEITDLTALLERLVEGLRATTERHTVIMNLPTEPVQALIDPLRIEQAVTNLVDNAIKYSPEGGLIDLTLTPLPAQQLVQLKVKDQGVGIPVEHREHIFEQFYQAQHRGFAGIGMGLYITRQIIELHGGQIEVEYPDEGGTCFVVLLPDGSGRN